MNQLPELKKSVPKRSRRFLEDRTLACVTAIIFLIAVIPVPPVFSAENGAQESASSGSAAEEESSVSARSAEEATTAEAINQEIEQEIEQEKEQTGDQKEKPKVTVDDEAVILATKDTTSPGNVSLDFKDADVLNVLRVLSLKSGTNIVAGPEVQGTVTIRLQDVPWEKAMEVVLRTYGYVYEREGNIIRVTTKDNLATEELVTETFVLNYTTAADIEAAIKDVLTERGRVKSVPKANTIIVSDAPTNMYKVSQVIKNLDQITPQVFIDAKVIRTQLDRNENLGINWNVQGSMTGSSRAVTFPFTAPGQEDKYNPINNPFLRYFYPSTAADPSQSVYTAPVGNAANAAPGAPTFGTLSFTAFTAALGYLRSKTTTKIVSNPRIVGT